MTEPETDGPQHPRDIIERIASVIHELPAIGKDQRNSQQNFFFRGIDDIMSALKPLLAKHEIVIVPNVVERIDSTRDTRSGGTMYVVLLHVQFTFYAPGGQEIVASGWGEGTDSGDKATNKAMTGAFKYVLVQVFAIADADTQDADHTSPEPSTVREPADEGLIQIIERRVTAIEDPQVLAALRLEWTERGLGKFENLSAVQAVTAMSLLNKYAPIKHDEPEAEKPTSVAEEVEVGADGWAATPGEGQTTLEEAQT